MDNEEIRVVLRMNPMLADLDAVALLFLIRQGKRRHFAPGQILMVQGEPSISLHFVIDGRVRVERRRRTDLRPVQLAELGPGSVVGEMGVIIEIPRTASVLAMASTDTLEIEAADFERITKMYPIVHRVIARILSERLRSTEDRLAGPGAGSRTPAVTTGGGAFRR